MMYSATLKYFASKLECYMSQCQHLRSSISTESWLME